jgi:hypothetical protein
MSTKEGLAEYRTEGFTQLIIFAFLVVGSTIPFR